MNAPVPNLAEPVFGNIPMLLVRPSKTNPRKRFDETYLQELAASIRDHGVASPITVRPIPGTEADGNLVEIVFGECRWRASEIAGRDTIPALVRELSDEEVIVLQVIENLQRKDVHPIEEAEGYQRLMDEFNYTADQLADKVGKSRSYIYGRLKFSALAPAAREAFFDGKLSASTALLIARIPVDSLQEHATEEIVNGGDPMSYREAFDHIQERYMLKLDRARFSITDAKLVKAAGACESCPKLTGNQPVLFKDVGADVCTDPNCFASKSRAHDDKTLASAQKKGIPVYEGEEAKQFFDESELITSDERLFNFERRIGMDNYSKQVCDLLTPDQLPKPNAYVRIDGKVMPMYEETALQAALEKAGICETIEQQHARQEEQASPAPTKKPTEAKPDIRVTAAEQETKVRVEAYKRIRTAAHGGLTVQLFRTILKTLLGQYRYSDYSLPDDLLGEVYAFQTNSEDAIFAHIDQAPLEELQLLLMDAISFAAIDVGSYDMNNDGSVDTEDASYLEFIALINAAGVDLDQVRAEFAQPDGTEDNAKSKAKTKKKAGKDQTDGKPAIDPAAAWPFPTGGRP